MKKLVLVVALLPMALSLSACKRGHSKNPARAAAEISKDPSLQGTWKSTCSTENKEMDGLSGGNIIQLIADTGGAAGLVNVKSYRMLYTFGGNSVTRSLVFYALDNCAQEVMTVNERGVFKLESDPNKKTNDTGRYLDLDMREVTVAVKDASILGTLNSNLIKLCDNTDWKADSKEREVTKAAKNKTCYGVEVPRKIPTAYRIDSGTMHFGKIEKAGERPASVNFSSRFTK